MQLTKAILQLFHNQDVGDIKAVLGGTFPKQDAHELKKMGVAEIFGVGTPLEKIRTWFREQVQ